MANPDDLTRSPTDPATPPPAPPPVCPPDPPAAGDSSREERLLLHRRLGLLSALSAAAFGQVALAFFTAAHWVIDAQVVGAATQVAAAVVAAACLAAAAVLFLVRDLSFAVLRTVEYALGLGVLGVFLCWQHGKLTAVPPGGFESPVHRAAVVELGHFHGLSTLVVGLVIFGLFIPDRPRRILVAGLVAVGLWVAVTSVALAANLPSAETLQLIVHSSVGLFLVALGVTYGGARSVYGLREQVRQLREVGPYHLIRSIGRGGMGEVWLAEHRLLKRSCAVKLIHPGQAANPEALKRFEREASLAARVRHPNVIEVYDYGRHSDGTFYCVTEYLSGLTLDELVARHGPQPPGRVVDLLRQALRGLGEAHRVGLVHRDVKPANLFLQATGTLADWVKVLDFGLVREVGGDDGKLTRSGVILGTPQFMAPEQVDAGGAVGPAADLYAAAAVGYFLLTGKPPFARESVMQTLLAHMHDPPPPLGPDVPGDLAAVLYRGLGKAPERRFPTATAMETALAGCACSGDWKPSDAEAFWETRQKR